MHVRVGEAGEDAAAARSTTSGLASAVSCVPRHLRSVRRRSRARRRSGGTDRACGWFRFRGSCATDCMFDHVGVNVRDYRASRAFYEGALAPLGWTVVMEWPEHGVAGFGIEGRPMFWLHEREPRDRDTRRIHLRRARDRRRVPRRGARGRWHRQRPARRPLVPRELLRRVRARPRRQQHRRRLPQTRLRTSTAGTKAGGGILPAEEGMDRASRGAGLRSSGNPRIRLPRALGRADRRAARAPRPRPDARARADRAACGRDRRVARVPVGRRRALPRARASSGSSSTRSTAARAPVRCWR